jgi:hypothetical protein
LRKFPTAVGGFPEDETVLLVDVETRSPSGLGIVVE